MKIKSNQELKALVEMLDDGDTIITTNSDWDHRVEKVYDTVVSLKNYPFIAKKTGSTINIGGKSIHIQTQES
jgi:hypothetical protein